MNRGRQKGIRAKRRSWARVTDLTLELRTGAKLGDVGRAIVPCTVCGHYIIPNSLGRHVACDPCSTSSDDSPLTNPS
jgi:hypothetical protein